MLSIATIKPYGKVLWCAQGDNKVSNIEAIELGASQSPLAGRSSCVHSNPEWLTFVGFSSSLFRVGVVSLCSSLFRVGVVSLHSARSVWLSGFPYRVSVVLVGSRKLRETVAFSLLRWAKASKILREFLGWWSPLGNLVSLLIDFNKSSGFNHHGNNA